MLSRSTFALVMLICLVACGQMLSPSERETGLTALSSARLTAMLLPQPVSAHRDRGPSWVAAGASSTQELLYVSDWNTDDVFIYNYKSGKLLGRLTGFDQPYGQCVDKNGNVWITNFASTAVVEYARGASKPMRTLQSAGRSAGCSVNPATGDLAVSNLELPAELQVFPHGGGKPTVYTNSGCSGDMWSPGYGDKGNLYVEASGYSTISVCELAHGGTTLRGPVKLLNFQIGLGGGVMWDGTHLALTDQFYGGKTQTALYRVTEEQSGDLTKVGQTVLSDGGCGSGVRVPQPFVLGAKNTPLNRTEGTTVLGGNVQCLNRFDFWHYPAGGKQRLTLQSAPVQPFGQAVSIAP